MSNPRNPDLTIACWSALAAIAGSFGAMVIALSATAAPPPNLNQQLTIYLNSGTRSPSRDLADRLLAQGQVAAQDGDWPTAQRFWQQAQQLYQQLGDMDGQALAYRYLATAYGQRGQAIAQEDALRRQLATTRDQRDFNGQIQANNALGRVLAPRAGGTFAAGTLFIEAMEVATSVRHQAGERLAATNLTWLANSLDQPAANARLVEMAVLPPSQWMANPVSLGLQLSDRGDQWLSRQRYFMATRFNRVAEQLAQQSDNYLLQFRTMADLVVAYRAMGRYDLASDWLDQRLQLARSLNDTQTELATLAALGEINLEIQRIEVAQRYFEQAIVVAEQLNDPQQTSFLRERLASFGAK